MIVKESDSNDFVKEVQEVFNKFFEKYKLQEKGYLDVKVYELLASNIIDVIKKNIVKIMRKYYMNGYDEGLNDGLLK